jgi:hypothetical protein
VESVIAAVLTGVISAAGTVLAAWVQGRSQLRRTRGRQKPAREQGGGRARVATR